MRYTIIVALSLLFITVKGQELQTITLNEVLDLHLYNTRNVQVCKINYENAKLEYQIYRKSLLPSIEMNVIPLSFNHSMKMLQRSQTGEYTNVEEFSNTTNASLTLRQTIGLTGGILSLGSSVNYLREFSSQTNSFRTQPLFLKYSQQLLGARKSYKFKKEISKKTYETAAIDYSVGICKETQKLLSYYIDAYRAKIDREYYEKTVIIGDSVYAEAKLRYQLGKISDFELNQSELQNISNQLNLVQANEAYSQAIQKLEEELQIANINVCQPEIDCYPKYLLNDEVITLVEQNNPQYLISELERLNAEYNLHSTKINNRFNANISLTYGLNQYAKSFWGAYKHPNQQQAVSITLTIPLFEWGAHKDRIKIAQNNYLTTVLHQQTSQEVLWEQTTKSVQEYNRNVQSIELAEKRYQLSERQYEIAIKRFKLGKITITDLIIAENEQLKAKQEFLTILHNLLTSYYQIQELTMYDFVKRKKLTDI